MGRGEIITAGHPPRHVASLDGIRAICCIGVIGHHFGFPFCQSGWIGVEMFFVLSGFLITTLLYREHRQTGSISLLDFWARRAFRLLPAYWLYAGLMTAVALLLPSRDFKPAGSWTLPMYLASIWAYFINFAPSGTVVPPTMDISLMVAGQGRAILFLLACCVVCGCEQA